MVERRKSPHRKTKITIVYVFDKDLGYLYKKRSRWYRVATDFGDPLSANLLSLEIDLYLAAMQKWTGTRIWKTKKAVDIKNVDYKKLLTFLNNTRRKRKWR
ncbi:MAG: hypothetical protein KAX20_03045 [Candidatus Omnitrophica bacterium]|nr:hypothetical protein [Candidatus Omnitrophota bacterium]